jgi:monofunctional chorismate mutase
MKTIEQLRQTYDTLDAQIIELLEARLKVSSEMGPLKKQLGLEIQDPKREQEILNALQNHLTDKDLYPYILKIYNSIFEASKELQANQQEDL